LIAGILLLVSIVSVGWSINKPWRPSWLYQQMEAVGWIHYRTTPEPFDPPRYSVLSLVPETTGTTMTWISSDHDRLTLSVESAAEDSGDTVVLRIRLNDESTTAKLDRKKLLAGQPLNKCFRIDESTVSPQLRELPAILQGMPTVRSYNPGGPIWVPSKSDPTKAWKIDRGASRVLVDDPAFGKSWHRCDVMYCDQLPFGVLQWKTTITSDNTGEILGGKTWVAEKY
jgi:hypothetical protein